MSDPLYAKQNNNWDFSWLVFILMVVIGLIISFFGIVNMMEAGWSGILQLFKFLFKSLGFMLIIVAGLVMIIALLIGIQALFSKWRKIKVFISYQHLQQHKVIQLHEQLKSRWLDVRYIPFAPAEHDDMIFRIRDEIKNSDVVLVLPGPDKSFVDAEILAASTLQKILIFLKMSQEQTMPDTALKGYPIFDFNELERSNFRPLVRFIYYTNKLWKDTLQNFLRLSNVFVEYFSPAVLICLILVLLANEIGEIATAFNLNLYFYIMVYCFWGITGLACLGFAFSYFKAIYLRLKAIETARQKIITRECTFDNLAEGLMYLNKDKQILDSLHQGSLPLRY